MIATYRNRAESAIAHGSLTNSKRPASFVDGVYPTHILWANKCYLTSTDKITYIDYICGLGTNYYGYGNRQIADAVEVAMVSGGCVNSLGSIEEVHFAERIKGTFPFIERMRFVKSGSEGCSAAVKIARAFTGKHIVYSEGYHGWHDGFVQMTTPANGVAHDGSMRPLKEILWDRAAAVIIEPIITDHSRARIDWLNDLKEKCDKHKVPLIFDETITAVRYKNRSVAQTYNILPDLWIGGKALCGGLSMSVVGGRADIMEADYFVSSTWAGDRLSCYAGIEACNLSDTTFKSEDLWGFGEVFQEDFNAISEHVQMVGYPTRGIFKYSSDDFKALFMQEMCKARVLIGPSWFYNKYLIAENQNVLNIAKSVVRKILDGKAKLEGQPPQSPFAEKVRNERA